MVATAAVSTARNKLLFSARQLYAIQWPLTVPLITTLKNPTTGALTLPNDGFVIGRHSKQRGGVLSNAQTYNDIMAHGQGSPVMKIPTERRMSGSLEPLELNKQNLQNWLGVDLSGLTPDAMSGIHIGVPGLPVYQVCRVALIGRHDFNGLAAWLVWMGNSTDISDTADLNLTDGEVVRPGYQWNFQPVDELNSEPVFVEIFGPGWDAMLDATPDRGGFFPPLTSIDVQPPTATLTGTAGSPTFDVQLTVTDSNLADRTENAIYVSSDATKATVNAHGLVKKVAAGSATITADVGGFTDTCVVTVT